MQTKTAKTTMFNLIILDESGSMSTMAHETISGCNELINTIKTTASNSGDEVRTLVSIYAFQSGGPVASRYLVKNAKPEDVKHITTSDYEPWGGTPLLDAVGSTLSELMAVSQTHEDATGTITIMTDGYENASLEYTWEKVAKLISWFKEMGWTVNLIGCNVDVKVMASQMSIDHANTLSYKQSSAGTKAMWTDFTENMQDRIREQECYTAMEPKARVEARKKVSKNFFKKK